MERLGCTLSKFEVRENPKLAKGFMDFYGYELLDIDFITAVFTRTEDKGGMAVVRKDTLETCLNTLSVLEQTDVRDGVFVTQTKE